jgi:flagellar FliL protein
MAEGEEPVAEKKKSRKLLWILLSIAVVAIAVVGTLLLLDYFRPPGVIAAKGEGSPENQESVGAEEGVSSRVKSTMNLDAFLVNLADQDSTRFVKLTVRLGLDRAGVGAEYAEDPVIVAAARDKIISILTTKTSDQILTPEGKDKLRKEIKDLVNPLLGRGKIAEVYIMDFVVQL